MTKVPNPASGGTKVKEGSAHFFVKIGFLKIEPVKSNPAFGRDSPQLNRLRIERDKL